MEGQQLQEALNPEKLNSLKEWMQNNSITLTQVNGQRKYGGPPPGWEGPAPDPGCEVFISQIPRDVYEDQLIPLFQSIGTIYEFRLMMNFSGQNRGFAYAKYGNPLIASAAVTTLNQYRLPDGASLTVRKSTEKRQLRLGDLPANANQAELQMALRTLSEGVEDVLLKMGGPKGREVMALVNYSSHYTASMAKKVLVQAFRKQYGMSITVKWASTSKCKETGQEGVCLNPPALNLLTKLSPRHLHPQPSLQDVPENTPLQSLFRAVGGPATVPREGMTTQVPDNHDSVSQLQWLCEVNGLGVPQYEVHFHHAGPDGFLYFTFKVQVPDLPLPLYGFAQILPGSSTPAMKAEVYRSAAEQVIQTMCKVSNMRPF